MAAPGQGLVEGAPGVEAESKACCSLPLRSRCRQRVSHALGSHVLDVHLEGLQTQLDLHLAYLGPHPHGPNRTLVIILFKNPCLLGPIFRSSVVLFLLFIAPQCF